MGQLQLKNYRSKRGINEIGTLWKWIAGTPDHDDLILINNKLNELVESNNKQFTINSEIFKAITRLTDTLKNVNEDSHARLIFKKRNSFILNELQNLIQTLTLGKIGILNPTILHLDEIRNLTGHEHGKMTITDLMDVSEFKILQNTDVIVIYIKYPKIRNNCKFFDVRAIAQNDGKLILSKNIAKCGNEFLNVQNCKSELTNNFCKNGNETSCLSNILNGKESKCKKIKERNNGIEKIKEGAILISGKHKVDNKSLEGVYLITFENTTIIDEIIYENIDFKIWNYVKNNKINNYEIIEYIESDDINLQFENINLLSKVKKEIQSHPVLWTFVGVIVIVLTVYFIFRLSKILEASYQEKRAQLIENTYENICKQIENLTK